MEVPFGTDTHFRCPLPRFSRHLDWHDHPVHLDLAMLVQRTGIANHFVVAASSSITKGGRGKQEENRGDAEVVGDYISWGLEQPSVMLNAVKHPAPVL